MFFPAPFCSRLILWIHSALHFRSQLLNLQTALHPSPLTKSIQPEYWWGKHKSIKIYIFFFYYHHTSVFYRVNFINLKSIPGPVVPTRTWRMWVLLLWKAERTSIQITGSRLDKVTLRQKQKQKIMMSDPQLFIYLVCADDPKVISNDRVCECVREVWGHDLSWHGKQRVFVTMYDHIQATLQWRSFCFTKLSFMKAAVFYSSFLSL